MMMMCARYLCCRDISECCGSVIDDASGLTNHVSTGFQKLDDLETAIFLSENQECPICFDDHPLGDFVAIIPCGHTFHRKCLKMWTTKRHETYNMTVFADVPAVEHAEFECPTCGTARGV